MNSAADAFRSILLGFCVAAICAYIGMILPKRHPGEDALMLSKYLWGGAAVFAGFACLSCLQCLLTLMSGSQAGIVSELLRFHWVRKWIAFLIGTGIAVAGFAAASSFSPKWSLVPVGVGVFATQTPAIWAFLREQPWFYRIFRSGRAPEAEFAQVHHLKKSAKSFRSTFRPNGGYCSDSLFIGTSTRENA